MNQAIEGPSPNLVAAYSFDRDATGSTGTVINEQGTTALNGTRTNGATVEKSETAPVNEMPKPLGGVTGNILDINDVNGSTTDDDVITTIGAGAIPSAVTMEAWVNFDRAETQDNFMALATAGDGGVAGKDNPRFVLYKNAAGKLYFWLQDDDGSHGSVIGTTSKVIDADVWYHIAATYDTATDTATLYLNGESVASGTVTDFTIHAGTTINFAAGSDNGGIPFDGQMNNVRVWSTARTAAEVREGMSQSYDYDTSGLLIQYTWRNRAEWQLSLSCE